jgi:hypothetical protein
MNTSFVMHKDIRSHSGATKSWESDSAHTLSSMRKINTRSSTIAEIVSVVDVFMKFCGLNCFLKGLLNKQDLLHRVNQISMKLEING